MIRPRFKKVLLVAPEIANNQWTADYQKVTHIYSITQLFPSIYELSPCLIVLDYNYASKDVEKAIRRIRSNSFYSKIKICCYKTKPDTKTDGLLKAIGVDYVVYHEEANAAPKSKTISHIFSGMFDLSVLGLATNATN